jgi:hypothetical protein
VVRLGRCLAAGSGGRDASQEARSAWEQASGPRRGKRRLGPSAGERRRVRRGRIRHMATGGWQCPAAQARERTGAQAGQKQEQTRAALARVK